MANQPAVELADIVRAAGPQLCAQLAPLPSQRQALADILRCRTAALGGQVFQCEQCQARHYSYHSCGNRHCPKCHGEQTDQWLDKQRERLLPTAYYLVTFTLPATLRSLAYAHQKTVYGLLMQAAAATINTLCADPKWMGGQPAILAVLHTWRRDLRYHPHVHLLVSAGGLSPDGRRWMPPVSTKFLLPVHAMSAIFRAKVRDGLQRHQLLNQIPRQLWGQNKKWVVHAQPAGRGEKVLEYLGRYVFRIAISNWRLEKLESGQVTFRYRNNRTQSIEHVTVSSAEFLRRYLQHVLPKGFAKVRHYGLDSTACQARLQQVRSLLAGPPQTPAPVTQQAPPTLEPRQTSSSPLRCSICGGGLHLLGELLPERKVPP